MIGESLPREALRGPVAEALKLFSECEHKWMTDAEMHAIAEATALTLSLITGQPPDVYRMPAVMALELQRRHEQARTIHPL